jgi:hypothetical protein
VSSLLAATAAGLCVTAPPRTAARRARPQLCFAAGTSREYVARTLARLPVESFQIHPTLGKWEWTATDGDVPVVPGTPLTLTWTVVPDGTPIGALGGVPGESTAASNLRAFLDGRYGSSATWLPLIAQALENQWGALTGVTYQYVAYDDMAPLANGGTPPFAPGVLGTRADVRIGGHFVDGPLGVIAYNYYPDIGDMVIDTGDLDYGVLGFRNMVAHEAGHGLGLMHVCPADGTKVMEPYLSTAHDGPQLDDRLAGWRQYGDDREDNDSSATATDLGTFASGSPAAITQVAIEGIGESDYYRFSVPAGRAATVTLSPIAAAPYLQGPQTLDCDADGDGGSGAPTLYDPRNQKDLAVSLFASDFSVFGLADANGPGGTETIPEMLLATGVHYVSVYGGGDTVQAYQLVITLSDPTTIAIDDVSMSEGNAGTTTFTFHVSLSVPAPGPISVEWATAPSDATTPSDFTTASGTLTFLTGQSSKTVSVSVNGDTTFENDETFFVNLSLPSGAMIADGRGRGTIVNDDAMPALAIDDVTLPEGNAGSQTYSFTVSLSGPSGYSISVHWATSDVTAAAGSDFVAASGSLGFTPGQTSKLVNVTVNGDTQFEPNEIFAVNLSSPLGATFADFQGVGTIVNDDIPPARVFVSVLGLDTNDCSNVATPCRTLNAAIGQVASDGEVIVTRSGSYAGATVTKGVKLDAAPGVVAYSGQPIVVNSGPGTTVVIRGLTLKAATPGSGTGLLIQSAGAAFVENTVIDGWDVGIQQGAPAAFIKDSTIRNNNTGLHTTSGKTTVDNSRFSNNGGGIVADIGELSLRNSTISGNTTGISADGSSAVTVEKSQIANNDTGIKLPASSMSFLRLSRSVVSGNSIGLENAGGTLQVYGNNAVWGNGTNTTGPITTTGLQ